MDMLAELRSGRRGVPPRRRSRASCRRSWTRASYLAENVQSRIALDALMLDVPAARRER